MKLAQWTKIVICGLAIIMADDCLAKRRRVYNRNEEYNYDDKKKNLLLEPEAVSSFLDRNLQHYRNYKKNGRMVIHYFKLISRISKNEGIFRVGEGDEYGCSYFRNGRDELNQHTVSTRRNKIISLPKVYVKGFNIAEVIEKEVIVLKNSQKMWRVGNYSFQGDIFPKYTMDRDEAEEYLNRKRRER